MERVKRRLMRLKTDCTGSELSGALGDLGTLIPLTLGLAKEGIVELVPALFFAGFYNIITGFTWDIPMPVQPMKSIAATALAGDLTGPQVTLAGIIVGVLVTFVGCTRLIELINRLVPVGVVYGIQIGVGLKLLVKGAHLIESTGSWTQPDSMTTGLIFFMFIGFFIHMDKFPTALVVFVAGCLVTVGVIASNSNDVMYRISSPFLWVPSSWSSSDLVY